MPKHPQYSKNPPQSHPHHEPTLYHITKLQILPTFSLLLADTIRAQEREDILEFPLSLSEGYFPVAYSVGARIHSDSWGDVADYTYNLGSY